MRLYRKSNYIKFTWPSWGKLLIVNNLFHFPNIFPFTNLELIVFGILSDYTNLQVPPEGVATVRAIITLFLLCRLQCYPIESCAAWFCFTVIYLWHHVLLAVTGTSDICTGKVTEANMLDSRKSPLSASSGLVLPSSSYLFPTASVVV